MKNLQRGFGAPLIIAIIAVLAIGVGGGMYVYQDNKKVELPVVIDTNSPQTNVEATTSPVLIKENSPAKLFLEEAKKLSGVNFEIKKESKVLTFDPGIRISLNGYSFDNYTDESQSVKLPTLLNSTPDYYNSGDATIAGSSAFKNESVICVHYYRRDSDVDPYAREKLFCADHDVPSVGQDQVLLNCYPTKCDVSGVNTYRSDFYMVTDNRKVKILIDTETRLRDGTKQESDGSHSIIKWSDFYPMILGKGEGKSISARIYGDWVDEHTFKANWITWPTP